MLNLTWYDWNEIGVVMEPTDEAREASAIVEQFLIFDFFLISNFIDFGNHENLIWE